MNRDLCVDLVFELEDTKRSSPFQTRAFCQEVSLFKGLAWNVEVFFYLSSGFSSSLTQKAWLMYKQWHRPFIYV
jgi:hypothetical protein